MTATLRFTRVAVAVVLGATAPLVLHVDAQAATVHRAPRVAAVTDSASTPAMARHARPAAVDTSARRDHGRTEHAPAAPRRRTPKAKSGSSSASPSGAAGQYVPDQPWETEFFVDNTLPTRHFAVRLASVEKK
jgi:hypothetical protein